jgi:DNA repair protein RecN (Recombination protein N)
VGLALTLGARASQGMVRTGQSGLAAEARFRLGRPDPELREWLDDPEAGEGAELVLARTVGADGRSSARAGGKLAPVSTLAAMGARLVEIHGQNQAERLGSAAAQLEFLDRFLGPEHLEQVARHRTAFAELRRVRTALEELDRGARDRERERDLLEYQIREIETAQLSVGELAALQEEDAALAHAERIQELAATAEDGIGRDGGGADALRQAVASLQAIRALVEAAAFLADRAAVVVAEAEDLLADIRAYRDSVQIDPARLNVVRERIQAIRSLERKYGDGEAGILAYLSESRVRLEGLMDDAGSRDELEASAGALAGTVGELAMGLTERRREAAPRLSYAVADQITQLGMPGATVTVDLVTLEEPAADGAERAEFRFSGGTGQTPLPLGKAASGGELSRVMLACRSVLAGLDDVPTLVFDEVDAGIGGRTAHAVAERLAALARERQVVVVTHLAQIAARADRHFVVSKEGGEAAVRPVEGEERVEEIARMLSGKTGDVSLAHARELLHGGAAAAPSRRSVRAGTGSPR